MADNDVIQVSSAAQLTAALNSATGGETILLAGGNYSDFNISNLSFNSEVTISSLNPNDMAVFQTIELYNVENLTFDGISVDFVSDANTTTWTDAVQISNSSDIIFKNSVLEGDTASTGSPEDAAPGAQSSSGNIIGLPTGRAIDVENSNNIVIENNDISVFYRGIVLDSTNNVDILNNEIHDLRISPLAGSDVHNVNVEGNYFHSSYPWAYGGDGDHGDYIHFWIASDQTTPSENITISSNYFAEGDGQSLLGIYIENHGNMSGPQFTNMVIYSRHPTSW